MPVGERGLVLGQSLPLGRKVLYQGFEGMIVARTLGGQIYYDLRFGDGTVIKYVPAEDCQPADDQPPVTQAAGDPA